MHDCQPSSMEARSSAQHRFAFGRLPLHALIEISCDFVPLSCIFRETIAAEPQAASSATVAPICTTVIRAELGWFVLTDYGGGEKGRQGASSYSYGRARLLTRAAKFPSGIAAFTVASRCR
jgi:hypothetical protein